MIWQNTKQCVKAVDAFILQVVNQFKLIDKVRVAMFITWLWALAGLYTTKVFESFFRLILKMPDNWLAMPQSSTNTPVGVRILTASDGQRDITNKFKLFLRYYWEKDDAGGGFSFQSLQRLMNCSMLYCSYLLTDKNGSISPDAFWQNVDRFLIELNGEKCVKYVNSQITDPEDVPFGSVSFTNVKRNTKQTNNKTRQDLLDFMDARDAITNTQDLSIDEDIHVATNSEI